jgi:hypothetical protein
MKNRINQTSFISAPMLTQLNQRATAICLLILSLILTGFTAQEAIAAKRKLTVTCSEQDAEIFANGKLMGKGSAIIIVQAYSEVTVRVEKVGFLFEEIIFYNKPNFPYPPKTHHFKLRSDDAYEASRATDVANVDLEMATDRAMDDAWRIINSVVLSYFDVLETIDKETGYIRTAWTVHNFTQSTVRTRAIIKRGSVNPLTFKLKLISEIAPGAGVSVKEDQLFKEWPRVLRQYDPVTVELPNRVK